MKSCHDNTVAWRLQWVMAGLDNVQRDELLDILRTKARRCVVFLMIIMLLSVWFGFMVGRQGCM